MEIVRVKTDRLARLQENGVMTTLEERNIKVNEMAERIMEHPDFFETAGEEWVDITMCTPQELQITEPARMSEILAAARNHRLESCPSYTALLFRLEFTRQEQSKSNTLTGTHESPEGAITFISEGMEPDDDSFPKDMYLRNVSGQLWLRGYNCDDDYLWPVDAMLAFKRAQ